MFLIYITFSLNFAYADDESTEPPLSVKSLGLSTQDIAIHLGLQIYKYSLRIPPDNIVNIILEDKVNNRKLIEFTPDKRDEYLHNVKFSFKKEGNAIGNPFESGNEFLVYEINWDQYQTRSGSLTNFMYGYKNQSTSIMADDFGHNFEDKVSIIKFYAYPENSEEEKYIAELYIIIEKPTS